MRSGTQYDVTTTMEESLTWPKAVNLCFPTFHGRVLMKNITPRRLRDEK